MPNRHQPGWRKAELRPRTLGLRWATGKVPTPLGDLRIAWEKQDDQWELDITLPANMELHIALPRLSWGAEKLTINGQKIWETDGIKEYQEQAERRYSGGVREVSATLQGPGSYSIELMSI